MGTWSPDILGSDSALDALGDIRDFFKIRHELYPMGYDAAKREKIRVLINAKVTQDVFASFMLRIDGTTCLVVAALLMYVGANFDQDARMHVISAIDDEMEIGFDDWNTDSGLEREEILTKFRATVVAYQNGNPVEMTNRGLFEMIATKMATKMMTLDDKLWAGMPLTEAETAQALAEDVAGVGYPESQTDQITQLRAALTKSLAFIENLKLNGVNLLGEGIHAGLRKGTYAEDADKIYDVISESQTSAWRDSIVYAHNPFFSMWGGDECIALAHKALTDV